MNQLPRPRVNWSCVSAPLSRKLGLLPYMAPGPRHGTVGPGAWFAACSKATALLAGLYCVAIVALWFVMAETTGQALARPCPLTRAIRKSPKTRIAQKATDPATKARVTNSRGPRVGAGNIGVSAGMPGIVKISHLHLHHPNITKCFDGTVPHRAPAFDGGNCGIVGKSLGLDCREFHQIAHGLKYVHSLSCG